MSKRITDNPDEIYQALLDDPAFTEAASMREVDGVKKVYIQGADGSYRQITQIELVEDEKND